MVLVGFVVKGPNLISRSMRADLESAGFHLPGIADEAGSLLPSKTPAPPAGPGAVPAFKVVVGIPWTLEEFINQAIGVEHPRQIMSGLPEESKETITKLVDVSSLEVGQRRTEELRKWMSRASDLQGVEESLKERLPEHCAQILKKKRLALFKERLECSKHKDATIVADMAEGFRISGPIPLTTEALRRSARVTRKGIIHSNRGSGDPELDSATYAATMAELEKGWLRGPVPESSLPSEAVVTRRFGVWQNGKCRPIDNFLEPGVNATTSACDTITVHTADCVAANIAFRMHERRRRQLPSNLVIKSWDLTKAYKNLPLHSDALSDAFLSVWNPTKKCTELFGQSVLPFGARSSVHGFCRVSLGIWIIGLVLFMLQWSVYFDDFIGVETEVLSKIYDLCVEGLFAILGWETAEDKDTSFGSVAKVLGLRIDLGAARFGRAFFTNTDSRKDELTATITGILERGFLSRKDVERLRGRLQFAENQISGK